MVEYAIVAEDCVVGEGAHVGRRPEETEDKDAWGVAVIGAGVRIGAGVQVGPKAMVERDILEV